MARITANGVEMRAHTLFTAPGRAVAALQRETGMKLQELVDRAMSKAADSETWSLKVTEFLSEQARGNLLTLEQVWDRPLPLYVLDADEQRRVEEAGAAEVPTPAGTDTPAPDTSAEPVPARKTSRSSASTPKSRGSRGKSAAAS